jgi:TPR repeat protein
MRKLFLVATFCLCMAPAARAADLYAVQPVTPGNTVVYPKRLRVLREVLPSLQEKAATGDTDAQRNLGEKLLMLDEKTEALKWLKKSADQGNGDTLYLLGYLALKENKTDEGVKWLEKAAGNGNTEALVALGDIYLVNRRDPARSFPYFKRGAEAGNAYAQHRLAVCYSQGWGVKKDVKKGLGWLKTSAGNGATEPMLMLFEIYSDPQPAKLCGVKTNPAKALYWIERATASRAGSGLFELFEILEKGKGEIPADPARDWLWTQ